MWSRVSEPNFLLNLFISLDQNKTTKNLSFSIQILWGWKVVLPIQWDHFLKNFFELLISAGVFSVSKVSVPIVVRWRWHHVFALELAAICGRFWILSGTGPNKRKDFETVFVLNFRALENHFVSGRLCRIDIRWSFYSPLFMLHLDPHLGLRWSNNKHCRAFSMRMDEMTNAMANCLLPSS